MLPPNDKDLQIILGTLLRVGVIASMTIVLLGGVVYIAFNYTDLVNYTTFRPNSAKYSSIGAVFSGLRSMDGAAIIQSGILLLIFTPVLRVVFSVFGFLIERDYLYVSVGLFVLSVILFSLSNSLVG
ncbi:MAG: DUF1634 domain-containing protein [Bacteroidota bacterium]